MRRPSTAPSETFTLRSFRVEAGQPAVIDDGGPVPLPAPAAAGPLPDRLKPRALAMGG